MRIPRGSRSAESELLRQLLRDTRAKAQLTQEELAKKLDTTQGMVSKTESGERRADFVAVWQYVRACNVPFAEFVQEFEHRVAPKRKKG